MVVVCVCFVVIADWLLLFGFGLDTGLGLLIWLFDDWLVVPIVVCLLLCLLIWCFGCMFGGCGGFGGLLDAGTYVIFLGLLLVILLGDEWVVGLL